MTLNDIGPEEYVKDWDNVSCPNCGEDEDILFFNRANEQITCKNDNCRVHIFYAFED